MKRLVEERDRSGPYRSLAELASRSGVRRDALERLAWAGACDGLARDRREALWRLGISAKRPASAAKQLALPLEPGETPDLRQLSPWELMLADYSSTGVSIDRHPMELLREELGARSRPGTSPPLISSALARTGDGTALRVAGLVVARQRPASARGVVFMLLEDELGQVNVIIPPPAYERCRLAVRTASFVVVSGRLERRDGVTNVLAAKVEALELPGPRATVTSIEPDPERETGRDLAAVMPRAHSFGRRGR
jgi:error-prone DNA polymerase